MPIRSSIHRPLDAGRLYDSVIDTVGDTPAIRINNLGVAGRTIYAKAEFFIPRLRSRTGLRSTSLRKASAAARSSPGKLSSRRQAAIRASASQWSARKKAIRSSSRWPTASPSSDVSSCVCSAPGSSSRRARSKASGCTRRPDRSYRNTELPHRADTLRSRRDTNETDAPESGRRPNATVAPGLRPAARGA